MTLTKQQLQQLEVIKLCPKHKRKHLLKKVPNSAVKAIAECCLNLLKNNIKISREQKKNLVKHKTVLRKLSERKLPLFKKRKILVQKGSGILSILIPAAIAAISNLFHG